MRYVQLPELGQIAAGLLLYGFAFGAFGAFMMWLMRPRQRGTGNARHRRTPAHASRGSGRGPSRPPASAVPAQNLPRGTGPLSARRDYPAGSHRSPPRPS